MKEPIKIQSKENANLFLKATPGHFASDRFHINYYIDMTSLKMRQTEAMMVAKVMSQKYVNRVTFSGMKSGTFVNENLVALSRSLASMTPIDTIVCMDGCEVIGGYVALELSNLGVTTLNKHHSFYVISPEFDASGQMVVRDNIKPMLKGRNVLVILASAMSGGTIQKSLKCINAYGGIVQGVSVIFGAVSSIEGIPVHAVFTTDDLPDFKLSDAQNCQQCKDEIPLDAIVNSYGYSVLN